MAALSKWTIFIRAFLLALLAGQPARVGSQTPAEEEAWRDAQSANTPQAYLQYLSEFPASPRVQEAIEALRRTGALGSAGAARGVAQSGAAARDPY